MSVITNLIPDVLPTYYEKYRVGGYNRLGKECYAKIMKRVDSAGSGWPIAVKGQGQSPIIINTSYTDKDFFSPITGSTCKMSMVAESYNQLLELGKGDDTMWRVQVVEDSSVVFRGYLITETFQMEYGYEKPVVSIDATDGLGVLRSVVFLDEVDFMDTVGEHHLKDIISYLLYKAGNTEIWRDYVYYNIIGKSESKNLIHNIQIPVWDLYGKNCYDVLLHVMSIFNMQITSDQGIYVIRLLDRPEQRVYDFYSRRGLSIASNTDDKSYINIYDNYKGLSGRLISERPVRKINFRATNPVIGNLLYNGDFSKGTDGWDAFGGYTGWHVTTQNYLQLNTGSAINVTPHKGVKSNFSRGYSNVFSVLVEFEIRVQSYDAGFFWRIHLSCDGSWFEDIQWQQTPNEWAKLRYVRTYSPFDEPSQERHIYIRPWSDGGAQRVVQIRNMTMTTGTGNIEDFIKHRDYTEEWTHVVNEKSSQDVNHNIHYAYGGGNYVYSESFPFHPYPTSSPVINDRRTSQYGVRNKHIQESRYIQFHKRVRNRLSLDLYKTKTSAELRTYSLLFNKMLERTYMVMSKSYDLIKAKYSVELMEYNTATTDEQMVWLLADDVWNDNGYWIDTASWPDEPE